MSVCDIYVGEGSAYRIGRGHGEQLAAAVGIDVMRFFGVMERKG